MVVVTWDMEADCWRSLVVGLGYLESMCLSGGDYWRHIRSEASSEAGLI